MAVGDNCQKWANVPRRAVTLQVHMGPVLSQAVCFPWITPRGSGNLRSPGNGLKDCQSAINHVRGWATLVSYGQACTRPAVVSIMCEYTPLSNGSNNRYPATSGRPHATSTPPIRTLPKPWGLMACTVARFWPRRAGQVCLPLILQIPGLVSGQNDPMTQGI